MAVKFLVQSNLVDNEDKKLTIQALRKAKLQYDTFKFVPFTEDVNEAIPILSSLEKSSYNTQYVFLGTTNLTKLLIKEICKHTLVQTPGIFTNHHFGVNTYISQMRAYNYNNSGYFLNWDAETLTLDQIKDMYGRKTELFIRPTDDFKTFKGGVYTVNDFTDVYDYLLANKLIKENDYFVVASKKEINRINWECRCVLAKNRKFSYEKDTILDASFYKFNNKHVQQRVDSLTLQTLQNFLDDYQSRSTANGGDFYIMDICSYKGELKIVEYGCINHAGLYAVDRGLIFNTISTCNFYLDNANW